MHQPSDKDLFIDLLSDWGFKYIFWKPANKDLLIHLINTLLSGKTVIKDLNYMNVEKPGKKEGGRASSLDLYCTTEANEHIVIEIQRHGDEGFIPRSLFYATHVLHEQAEKGDHWQYNFKPTYIIGILDFELIKDDSTDVIRSVRLMDEATNAVIYPNLSFVYVELPKFTKALNQLETDLDYWLFHFKHLAELKERPKLLDHGVFTKLMNMAALGKMTTEERVEYMGRVGAEWKEYTTRETQKKLGRAEGRAEGRLEGLAEGRVEGLKEGRVEGVEIGQNNSVKVLKAFLHQQKSPEQIAAEFKLPLEKVQQIVKSFEES